MKNNQTIRVLIVDDLEIVLQDLKTALELCKDIIVVGEASSGTRAIELVGELQPDIILMDLNMPAMNGFEAATQIRELTSDCRLVAFTIYDNEEYRLKASRCGFDAFMVKGISLKLLEKIIQETVKK